MKDEEGQEENSPGLLNPLTQSSALEPEVNKHYIHYLKNENVYIRFEVK